MNKKISKIIIEAVEGLEQLQDDMNAFNQSEVIRLNKKVRDLEIENKRLSKVLEGFGIDISVSNTLVLDTRKRNPPE